jgi:hypothetical protein
LAYLATPAGLIYVALPIAFMARPRGQSASAAIVDTQRLSTASKMATTAIMQAAARPLD